MFLSDAWVSEKHFHTHTQPVSSFVEDKLVVFLSSKKPSSAEYGSEREYREKGTVFLDIE